MEQNKQQLQLQMISQQVELVQDQIKTLQEQEKHLELTINTLNQFAKTKVGSETYVSLGTGIFTKAEIKENQKLLVNVGAGIVVEKDIESTKELVNEQLNEIAKVSLQLSTDLQKLLIEANKIETCLGSHASQN